MEVALMKEHRFAFYFWFKWRKRKKSNMSAALVSLDWHQDLCEPCDAEKKELQALGLDSYIKAARFCWEGLNPLNDGHVLAAAYLNLVGNVYVLCKQEIHEDSFLFQDVHGNLHAVFCFDDPLALYSALAASNEHQIYFDIDLDYFTESPDPCGGGTCVTVVNSSVIASLLSPHSQLMLWCFRRMKGMTIATEPKFCGGVRNSNIIFDHLDRALFDAPLLSMEVGWKHLRA